MGWLDSIYEDAMMKSEDEIQRLIKAMEYILSRPPSQVGKRLRSERELATHLKANRYTVKSVFNHFVDSGYLARRPGSGTYVRKVTPPPKSAQKSAFGLPFSADDLFAPGELIPVRKAALAEHRQLKLAFVFAAKTRGESQKHIIAGIEDRVKQAGHKLKIHTIDRVGEEPISVEALTEKLHSISCDGYILWSVEAKAVNPEFLKRHAPAVYVGDDKRYNDSNYSPLVRVGMEDATLRAIDLLVQQGYQRIGYIDLPHFGEGLRKNRHFYEWALQGVDLSYRRSEFVHLDEKSALLSMRRMFNSADRPEAVYVADDIVLRHVAKAWQQMKLIPGKDFAVITHSNRGVPLPTGFDWSRMEFHPFQLGRIVVDSLLLEIQNAGEAICSVEHLAIWHPGSTHTVTR